MTYFSNLSAQKKVSLFVQLTGETDLFGDLNFRLVRPPRPSSKKVKVKSIDTLINFDEINEVIKKQDYKGIRILNELSLLGWKLQFTAMIGGIPRVFERPQTYFILSK